MEVQIETATKAVKKLYNAFKDYKNATTEAQDLADRLYMLDTILQRVPNDTEMVREPLGRLQRTVDDTYVTLNQRLQLKDGRWKKPKDLASSSSDRKVLTEIAWDIRNTISDLHMALTLQSNEELHNVRERLENRGSSSNMTEGEAVEASGRADATTNPSTATGYSATASAKEAVKNLYNMVKDYEDSNREAQDLINRLQMLYALLQKIPTDTEMVREPLGRLQQTVDDTYVTLSERLQLKDGRWKKPKDLASSSSDRQVLTEIAWEIRGAMSDLHLTLNQQFKEELQNVRELLENRGNSSNMTEGEAVEASDRANAITNLATASGHSATASGSYFSTGTETVTKYSWSDFIWEDGVGPTRDNPESCLIRRGKLGSVYKAVLQGVGDVAVKVLDIDASELRGRRLKEFKRECILLKRVSTHPNVVSFYGMLYGPDSFGLVTDLSEGDSLFAAINEEWNDYWCRLPTVLKLKALSGIIAAVHHMHTMGVIHANLKPQNVLLSSEMSGTTSPPTFWVSDFGLSRTMYTVKTSQGSSLSPSDGDFLSGGTLGYMAPETVAKAQVNEASDIFSLSISLWAALACEEPFQGVFDAQMYMYQVRTKEIRPDLTLLPEDVPESIVDLLKRGWDTDPEKRPSAQEFQHKWESTVSTLDDS